MRRRCLVPVALALLVASAGCRPSVDVAAETDALLRADRAWAAAAAAGEADSVLSFWADDARVAMPGAPLVEGGDAIRQMVEGSFAQPGFRITWTPERAVVAESGDLGYTTGTNEIVAPDGAGGTTRTVGRYLAVWRRDAEGRWRNVEDYASPAPADAAAPGAPAAAR